jgi:hypothetical protein
MGNFSCLVPMHYVAVIRLTILLSHKYIIWLTEARLGPIKEQHAFFAGAEAECYLQRFI